MNACNALTLDVKCTHRVSFNALVSFAVDIAGAFRLNITFDSDYSDSASTAFTDLADSLTDGVSTVRLWGTQASGCVCVCVTAVYRRLVVLPHVLFRKLTHAVRRCLTCILMTLVTCMRRGGS